MIQATRNLLLAFAAALVIGMIIATIIYTRPKDPLLVPTLPWVPHQGPHPQHPPHPPRPHPKPSPENRPNFPKDPTFNVHASPTKCSTSLIAHIHAVFNKSPDPHTSFSNLCNAMNKGLQTSCKDLRLRAVMPKGADSIYEFTNTGSSLKLPFTWPNCSGRGQEYPGGKTIWFRVNHQGYGVTFGLLYPGQSVHKRKWFPDYVKYF